MVCPRERSAGWARDPKPGGRYALDDARHRRNMRRNGSDELRVGGDLTRFLGQGREAARATAEVGRADRAGPAMPAPDHSQSMRISRERQVAGASRRDRAATREITSWQSNPST